MLCLGCNCEGGGQSETTAGVQEVTIKAREAGVCGGWMQPVQRSCREGLGAQKPVCRQQGRG